VRAIPDREPSSAYSVSEPPGGAKDWADRMIFSRDTGASAFNAERSSHGFVYWVFQQNLPFRPDPLAPCFQIKGRNDAEVQGQFMLRCNQLKI
jgi:hypothetical protein